MTGASEWDRVRIRRARRGFHEAVRILQLHGNQPAEQVLDYRGDGSLPLAAARLHDPAVRKGGTERAPPRLSGHPIKKGLACQQQPAMNEDRGGIEKVDDG